MGKARINDKSMKFSYKKTSMIFNDNRKGCGKVQMTTEVADRRAELLVEKFHAPQCRLFFLKCIYHLPEHDIQQAIESAMRPGIKSHIRYFVVVAKQKLQEAGY